MRVELSDLQEKAACIMQAVILIYLYLAFITEDIHSETPYKTRGSSQDS